MPQKNIIEKLCNIFWVAKLVNINLSMPKVEISKTDKIITIKGENLYLAKERSNTRELFFDLNIENKGEK